MIKKIYIKFNELTEANFPSVYKLLFNNRIFVKYLLVGFIAAIVDLVTLYFLVGYVLGHDTYLLSVASSFIFAFIFGVILQKFWTFQDRNTNDLSFQLIIYFLLATVNLFLNLTIVYVLVDFLSVWYLEAQVISMAVLASMNFILYSRFIFKKSLMIPGSVLLATGIFPPDIGGPAIHTHNFLKSFTERGIKTGVVTYSDIANISSEENSIDIERISRKIPFGLRHMFYVVKLFAAALRYEIIYAQDISAAGLPAVFVSKLVGRRFMVRVGGDLLWERLAEKKKTNLSAVGFYAEENYKKYFLYHVGQTVLLRSEKVIVPAELLANIYKNHYGISEDKIILLPNPMPDNCSQYIEKYDALSGTRNILFAGRFVSYKNLEKVIIAFANVYNDISPAKLIMVGDGPEKRNLLRLAKRLNISSRIIFKAKVGHRELINEIKESSVCIGPALTEFNPNFILECLSCKKPVLITKENGLSIKLPERFNLNSVDVKDIENKIVDLLGNVKSAEEEIFSILKNSKVMTWNDIIETHLKLFKNGR